MACRDWEGISAEECRHMDEVSQLSRRRDELAKLLCAAGEAYRTKTEPPPALLKWWEAHWAEDKAKREREERMQKLLNPPTSAADTLTL
jgi:hypothetical protein